MTVPRIEEDVVERGTRAVLGAVEIERHRQATKWGVQRHSFPVWTAVLMEEVGEFAQAVLKGREEALSRNTRIPRSWLLKQRAEAVQVAAVAVAIVEHLDELLAKGEAGGA